MSWAGKILAQTFVIVVAVVVVVVVHSETRKGAVKGHEKGGFTLKRLRFAHIWSRESLELAEVDRLANSRSISGSSGSSSGSSSSSS